MTNILNYIVAVYVLVPILANSHYQDWQTHYQNGPQFRWCIFMGTFPIWDQYASIVWLVNHKLPIWNSRIELYLFR
jgi:hypothetical protein